MKIKSNDSLITSLHLFSRTLPNVYAIVGILLLISVIAGIVSVALINYDMLSNALAPVYVLIDGSFFGIIAVLVPTLLTAVLIKWLKRFIKTKHLLFMTLIGAVIYGVFIMISAASFLFLKNYALANAIVLVGDAGVFGWWFFLSKVVLDQKKKAVIYSIIQPAFNILLYISVGTFVFTFSFPIWVIALKLSVGILIFLAISYVIVYMLDTPLKKNLGFSGIAVLSDMVQNWLFDIDVASSFGGKFGVVTDVETQTLVFKRKYNGSTKAILFAPWIHYGPIGSMGGSNFPYMLESYSMAKHKAPTLVLHCTVNESCNPVSSSQISALKESLDRAVKEAKKLGDDFSYSQSEHAGASLSALAFGKLRMVTLTRAPRVTEDVYPEAARMFKELLERDGLESLLLDAHNSRYESAPSEELEGVRLGTCYANDYIKAIKKLGKPAHKGKRMSLGVGYVEAYEALGQPTDLGPGNLNAVLFGVNGFRHVMVQLNANNMLPSFRDGIIKHIRSRYKISAEVCTTDTHYVNSLEKNASNVLGRQTSFSRLLKLVDAAVETALSNIEPVEVYYKKGAMEKFKTWGPEVRAKSVAIITSVTSIARLLVPAIVIAGFVLASWIITFV